MWSTALAIVLAFLIRLGAAADNQFQNPPPSRTSTTFDAGDVETIRWRTEYFNYNITLWQTISGHADDGIQISQVFKNYDGDGNGTHSFDWTVQTYDANMSVSDVFFFRLFPFKGWSSNFVSRNFTIPGNTASPTSSSAPSKTSYGSPTGSSTSATPKNSSSSDFAIKVGLGVGLGVDVPLVLIAGVWVGMKAVRQQRSSQDSVASSTPLAQLQDHKDQAGLATHEGQLPHQSTEIFEAPPYGPPVELPGDGADR